MSASLLARLFPDGAGTTTCPWPRAGRRKSVRDVDPQVVAQLLARAPGEDLEWIDPAELRSTQPSITRAGVAYYLGSDYFRTGTTYADMHSAANRVPVVYRRDDGQSLILTGHHRSGAALLQGNPCWRGSATAGGVRHELPSCRATSRGRRRPDGLCTSRRDW